MTTREALHQLVDELPEDQAELAHAWIQDLRDAAQTFFSVIPRTPNTAA